MNEKPIPTKSRLVLDSSNEDSSISSSRALIKANPTDFIAFLPWACRQLSVVVVLEISRVLQTEYVSRVDYKVKSKSKQTMKKGFVSASKEFTSSSASGFGASTIVTFGNEGKVVRILATFSNDQLVHIKIDKTRHLPREILAILNLIIKFYSRLYGITINSGADKYTIVELSKLLPLSNITEVNLDNTYIAEGNYDMILNKSKHLKVLSLARCKLNDQAVEKIVSNLEFPLPCSETLSALNLSTNRLTDKAATYIAKMLRTNRCLSYLNIAGNMVTDHGLEAILNVLCKFPLTADEMLKFRKRKSKYLRKMHKSIQNLEFLRDFDREKKKKPGKVSSKKSSKELSQTFSTLSDIAFHDKLLKMAEAECGKFNDPYGTDTVGEDGLLYSLGNNTLAYINFAYNEISWHSLEVLLKVLNYQKDLNRQPQGLINVVLEGNPLPENNSTLAKIESILEINLSNNKGVKRGRKDSNKK